MQFMATALKLQDEILGRWEHNFGIKFTKRVYDRATGEITTNRLEPYKRWLAEEMAKRMITTVNDMVDSIYRANCIYPAFNEEEKLLRGWRKDNNRFYKLIADKEAKAAAREKSKNLKRNHWAQTACRYNWWTSSASAANTTNFVNASNNGDSNNNNASNSNGVPIDFIFP